ncbi:MAG: Oligopeptide transport protein superfamily, ATP-binding protein (modular protein) [Ilumatobacteraceae bacterium]|nr:Oligopeptide transport protein superfamily, ATP-binding protein (modular protein) [Ilumatobacteraceae bacterium]
MNDEVAPILSVKDLTVEFPTDDGVVRAVRGISFDVRPRDVLGVVGESGCGKSVSSMAIMGLLPKSARITGSIKFRDRELIGLKPKEMRAVRGRQIAMVFQDPMTAMNPVYRVGWQLGEAIKAHNKHFDKKQIRSRSIELLNMVGIPQASTRVDNYPHEFSGGMRQRVMIAMAIANNPDVLIADEPTTALDVTVQAQILEMLIDLKDQLDAAIVLITHDLGVVAGITDRMQVMYAGKVVESGTAEDVFYTPRMPYSIGLLGSIPVHTQDPGAGARLKPIGGAPPSLINVPPGCPFSPRCPLSDGTLCETVDPPLLRVGPGHLAACHHSDKLAAMEDPLRLFSAVAE